MNFTLRELKGHNGRYLVADIGGVWDTKTNRFLGATTTPAGYRVVTLDVEDGQLTCLLHSLVAKTFNPNPEGKETVNHIDMDKTNNRASNLEWMTRTENTLHAWENKRDQKIGRASCRERV